MIGESGTLFGHVLCGQRCVTQRVELEILVICHDEEKIGLCHYIGYKRTRIFKRVICYRSGQQQAEADEMFKPHTRISLRLSLVRW